MFLWLILSVFFILRTYFLKVTISYEKVDQLSTRITAELKSIHELKRPEERFGRTWSFSIIMNYYDRYLLDNVYCSTEMFNHLEEITNKYKIYNILMRANNEKITWNTKDKPLLPDILKYIKENNIYCVYVDTFSNNEKLPNWIEIRDDYQKKYSFYKQSNPIRFNEIWGPTYELIISLLMIIFSFFVITIVYYKAIIRLIFHKKNMYKGT